MVTHIYKGNIGKSRAADMMCRSKIPVGCIEYTYDVSWGGIHDSYVIDRKSCSPGKLVEMFIDHIKRYENSPAFWVIYTDENEEQNKELINLFKGTWSFSNPTIIIMCNEE